MIKNYLVHKRNTSQSIKLDPRPKSSFGQKNKSAKMSHGKNKSNTLSLVQKSGKKVPRKQIVVESIQHDDQYKQSPFFAFGQKAGGGSKNWNLDIDKITQVQDSNSRRQINSHRSARAYCGNQKQNYNTSNIEQLRKSAKSGTQKQKKSKQKSKQRTKSKNDKTKSTIELSRVKHSRQLEIRTEKIQKSVKMLWECMGELWENSRVSQYKSQKNNQSINGIKRKIEEQEQKIMDIKFQMSKNFKNGDKSYGLRA